MSNDLILRNFIDAGVEAAACIGVGRWATGSFISASTAYGNGKVVYISMQALLAYSLPEVIKELSRGLAGGAALTVGAFSLYSIHNMLSDRHISLHTSYAATVGASAASFVLRGLVASIYSAAIETKST